jgi:hypothetical protein
VKTEYFEISDGFYTREKRFITDLATAEVILCSKKQRKITKAIKLDGAGQVMFSEKLAEKLPNGLDEAVVLDPVDGSLAAYEGIRMYVKIKRPAGKTYSRLNMRFFNGSYSYYRQFSEITVTLPDGDYEGYIECPFSEFVSGYNKEVKANNKHDISFFGFNISMEGNPEGLEVYVSDFGAYREMYW